MGSNSRRRGFLALTLTGYEGSDLEAVYDRLETEYERSEARAGDVRERIASIDQVATDMFAEWQDEIASIAESDRFLASIETAS